MHTLKLSLVCAALAASGLYTDAARAESYDAPINIATLACPAGSTGFNNARFVIFPFFGGTPANWRLTIWCNAAGSGRRGHFEPGSGGVGSMGQLNVEMLKVSTGVFTTHIPYRGGTPLITGALGNEVQFILDNPGLVHAIFGDRVARPGGWMPGARARQGRYLASAGNAADGPSGRATRREGPCRRATRRCAPCVCTCTRGVTRLD